MPTIIHHSDGNSPYNDPKGLFEILCEDEYDLGRKTRPIDSPYNPETYVPATLNKHAIRHLKLKPDNNKTKPDNNKTKQYTLIKENSGDATYKRDTASIGQTEDNHITDLTKIGQFKLSCREYHKSSSIPSDTETLKSILTGQKNDKNHTRGAKNSIATTINQALHTSIAMRVFYQKEINAKEIKEIKEIKERLMNSLDLPNTIMKDEYNIDSLTSAKEAQTLYDELLAVDYFPEHRDRRLTYFINFFNQNVKKQNSPRLTAFNKLILVKIYDKIILGDFQLDSDFMSSRLYQDLKSFMSGQAMKELDSRLLEHDHTTIP